MVSHLFLCLEGSAGRDHRLEGRHRQMPGQYPWSGQALPEAEAQEALTLVMMS